MPPLSLLSAFHGCGATDDNTANRFASAQGAAPFSLPPLPYDEGALAPAISSTTIGVHYGKHHKAYVDNLNKLVEDTDLAGKSLEDIAKAVRGDAGKAGVFNN